MPLVPPPQPSDHLRTPSAQQHHQHPQQQQLDQRPAFPTRTNTATSSVNLMD
ncbi:hypothetical protein HDU89_000261 [Geranomyces variabilis]|nr:hypothetical protein HDU89_000261 [Geranomyces variabilis]